MTEWWNRAVLEEKVRAILQRHSQFNATMHDADAPILNMLLTVKVGRNHSLISVVEKIKKKHTHIKSKSPFLLPPLSD
jgi:hypothetical protein